jgi:hypothetical protein
MEYTHLGFSKEISAQRKVTLSIVSWYSCTSFLCENNKQGDMKDSSFQEHQSCYAKGIGGDKYVTWEAKCVFDNISSYCLHCSPDFAKSL